MAKWRLALALSIAAAGVTWGYAQPGQISPVLTPQDYMEIQQLYAAYVRACDMGGAGDGSDYVSTFTPDGEFGAAKGPEALRKMIKTFHARLQKEKWSSRHTYSGLLITPTAEGAKGSVYALIFNVTATPPFVDHSGVYDDRLVKTRDGWRFKKRVFKFSGTFEPALP